MSKEKQEHLKTMSLGEHLEELRYRLIRAIAGAGVGLVVCLFFGRYLMRVIAKPYEVAMKTAGLEPEFIAIQPPEQFLVYIKTCLVFGLVISAPWVFYHIWAFVSSGLYRHERKFIYAVAPASALLFMAGALFFMVVIAPMAMLFFIKFDTGIDFVRFSSTLQNYVNLVLSLTLIFAVAFQMPIAIVFAERMGLVSIQTLTSVRRYVILGLVITAAIATPPDVISQIALAVPLYVLFEGSIVVCRFLRRRKK
jgi:sec-independent protein translocase protein TatC